MNAAVLEQIGRAVEAIGSFSRRKCVPRRLRARGRLQRVGRGLMDDEELECDQCDIVHPGGVQCEEEA